MVEKQLCLVRTRFELPGFALVELSDKEIDGLSVAGLRVIPLRSSCGWLGQGALSKIWDILEGWEHR